MFIFPLRRRALSPSLSNTAVYLHERLLILYLGWREQGSVIDRYPSPYLKVGSTPQSCRRLCRVCVIHERLFSVRARHEIEHDTQVLPTIRAMLMGPGGLADDSDAFQAHRGAAIDRLCVSQSQCICSLSRRRALHFAYRFAKALVESCSRALTKAVETVRSSDTR